MSDWLERTELLVGEEAIKNLKESHVLICGLGGVGSYAGEFIVRSGELEQLPSLMAMSLI